MSSAQEAMLWLAREIPDDLEDAFHDLNMDLDEVDGEYRPQILAAAKEAAELLAAAATGDGEAVEELKLVRATLMLWTWANAERQRRAFVSALHVWLRRAASTFGDLFMEVVEAGVMALVRSGLQGFVDD